MIGIIAGEVQLEVVAEFFELFKTPWEVYRPEHRYDVVLTTTDERPAIMPRLLILYGGERQGGDRTLHYRTAEPAELIFDGLKIPIYCGLQIFEDAGSGVALARCGRGTAALLAESEQRRVIRAGYDLFEEIRFLLTEGQPAERAQVPTLDLHIRILRSWIVSSGIPLLEIPPVPAGYDFTVCLTHDIDFTAIRNHRFDRSFRGFVYRASIGSVVRLFRGRLTVGGLLRNWMALARLPLVYAGWAKDFWEPFAWYLKTEQGLPGTYYLIPFRGRAGERVAGSRAAARAAAYDVADLAASLGTLGERGCEVGVHGIDAWHSADQGREEMEVIRRVTGKAPAGIRMHWLLQDRNTALTLERAGFAYDSTVGYNETVGYRAGTSQVYRPPGVQRLLEVPMHIQDGALFYPQRLDLTEAEAMERCRTMIAAARENGGVLTLLWHDRSHAPERQWGGFYQRLLSAIRENKAWFATGAQAARWFRKRRDVKFEYGDEPGGFRMYGGAEGREVTPPLRLRLFRARQARDGAQDAGSPPMTEYVWNGETTSDMEAEVASVLRRESAEGAPCVSR